MKLVIAEKPSVAKSIAQVLGANERADGYLFGGGYFVSWCVGHLVGLYTADMYDERFKKWNYDDLPIIPQVWQHTVLSSTKKQYQILKKLFHSDEVEQVIAATDAGREGELIFRLVYDLVGCKKPVQRLWISSMESNAIRQGFKELKDGSAYDNLYASALCRAKADWLIGINATRLFSVLYHKTLKIGRVQSPTLAMLVSREEEIRTFQKEKYYKVRLSHPMLDAVSGHITDQDKAEEICKVCSGSLAEVADVETQQKSIAPPKLYDLTTLQREANRIFGYTAQQTLDYTQELYEKKLLTYPRTDSQFLTDDMETYCKEMFLIMGEKISFAQGLSLGFDIGRVLDSKKVSDHHAIVPTLELRTYDIASLGRGLTNILNLVCHKFMCAAGTRHTYETTKITLVCSNHTFVANGITVSNNGWKELEKSFKKVYKDVSKDTGKVKPQLPQLAKGQILVPVTTVISEHTTAPAKNFTEDTLLAAMERAGNEDISDETEKRGLGTPATRASIIEKIIKEGFAERKNRQLIPTGDGIALVTILPESIKSARMTAQWEMDLTRIAKGELKGEQFLESIEEMAKDLVAAYHAVSEEEKQKFTYKKEVLGTCPRCGGMVVTNSKGFACESGKSCGFALWKNNKFFLAAKKELTPQIVKKLIHSGKADIKGLYSPKKDRTYDATLMLEDTGTFVNFKLKF